MRHLARRSLVWLAMSALLLGGCGRAHEESTDRRGAEGGSPPAPPSSQSASRVRLEAVSCQQWDKALSSQKGKIVVVDTWATWCLPCTEEFPQLVALHEKYSAKGVVCMSVTVDEPDKRAEALKFLQRNSADFANYQIEDKSHAWWDKWEIKAIPVVLVFNNEGKLAKKFDKDDPDNQFTYADVEKLVVDLLKRPRPNGS